MSILSEIIASKRLELASRMKARSLRELEVECAERPASAALPDTGIIAEMKRKSPSKGKLRDFNAGEMAREYADGGAIALSVLTDEKYFGGTLADLAAARSATSLPLLRKDFVIDRYQIAEAKVAGADIVLLLASVLDQHTLEDFSNYAKSLRLQVLIEVHDAKELSSVPVLSSGLIGVNNRDLKDFSVDLRRAENLVASIPAHLKKVAESGMHSATDVLNMRSLGFDYFLIGEHFMHASSPGKACREFQASLSSHTGRE